MSRIIYFITRQQLLQSLEFELLLFCEGAFDRQKGERDLTEAFK